MLKRKIFKKIAFISALIVAIYLLNIFPNNDTKLTIYNNHIEEGIVYLLDSNNYVSRVNIVYDNGTLDTKIRNIIDIMTENDNNELRKGFTAIIPKNTKLISYKIADKNITLNFTKELLNISKQNERKLIEALIYSFTSLDDFNSISILIDNKPLELLPKNNIKLDAKLTRNFKINKESNINNIHNINETIVYYLGNIDDYIYYIPVTKYSNKDKEKVEIIIEELTSSTTYNTNLVNYIHQETKLASYEILNKTFVLNFNNMLGNLNDNNLIETVKYAIGLSIEDNYGKYTVLCYDNNQLI